MNSSRLLIAFCLALAPLSSARAEVGEPEEFFERRVRPLLFEHCQKCHGPKKQEGGLRLDSRAGLLKGGERGTLIVDRGQRSRLITAVRYGDDELQMPPDGKLAESQIRDLERWLRLGAPFPASGDSQPQTPARRLERFRGEHWSLQPISNPAPPSTDSSWPRNDLDRFVLARLEQAKLKPSRRADPRTLIRRVYFDLLGLPPSDEQVRRFAKDPSPDAFAAVVERLLDRPEYGERWARRWLDVARYADTTGYLEAAEPQYPFAYVYRDYVVRSFNDDTPFDRFIVEQIAADQLPLSRRDRWKLAGMGMLTVGPRFNYNQHEVIDDRIDVVSRAFLGLTIGCARCHDHKYDPILTDDYYGLYGVFASSVEPLYVDLPMVGRSRGSIERYLGFRRAVRRSREPLENLLREAHRNIQEEMRSFAGDYLHYLAESAPNHRTKAQLSFETERTNLRGPTPYGPGALVRWKHFLETRTDDDPVFGPWKQLKRLPKKGFADGAVKFLARPGKWNPRVHNALAEKRPRSFVEVAEVYGQLLESADRKWRETLEDGDRQAKRLEDDSLEQLRQALYGPGAPPTMNLHEALECYTDGEFNEYMRLKRRMDSAFTEFRDAAGPRAMVLVDRQRPIAPRVFIRGDSTRPTRVVERRFPRVLDAVNGNPFQVGSGRLELARAIADPKNPLTARVIVNRVWHWRFGQGLVDTPSDFGVRGGAPSHPRLLDYLASRFIREGWSLKKLHRWMLNSATYQQASAENETAAEVDPANRLLSRMVRQRLEFEALRDSVLQVSGRLNRRIGGPPVELGSARRSIYVLINRQDPNPVLSAFDVPSGDVSKAGRSETTVPQQALFLLNHPFMMGAAERAIEDLQDSLGERASPQECVDWLYRRILGRPATTEEVAETIDFAETPPFVDGASQGRWRQLAQVLMLSNEFMFVD